MMACRGPTPGQSLPVRQPRIASRPAGSALIVPARPLASAETTDDRSLASNANPFAVSLDTGVRAVPRLPAINGDIGFDTIIENRDSALVRRRAKGASVVAGFM